MSFGEFVLTTNTYWYRADAAAAVQAEFGPDATEADWNEIAARFTGQIAEFCDATGSHNKQNKEEVVMRALLIEVDFETGKRAGGIDPRDPNLRCRGWQNLDSEPGLEIKVVDDNRDLSQYAGVPGVTVLEGKDAINAAIQANFPPTYSVADRELLLAHLRERGISFDRLAGKTLDDEAEELFLEGFAGIVKREPSLL